MSISTLSQKQLRLVNLEAQGLLSPPPPHASKLDVLNAIKRIGLLQIDTINIVARSSYFVLFSRVGNYQACWLDELQLKKSIVEQWAHVACYVPIEDYPLMRKRTLEGSRTSYFHGWASENWEKVNAVLDSVRSNGPMSSSDFKSPKMPGGWWNWKFEKAALEHWFNVGELYVIRRDNFKRVYDLHERAMPEWDDANLPSMDEVYRQLILKTIHVLGIARASWLDDYYRISKKVVADFLPELTNSGRVREVSVEGWEEPALYLPEDEPLLTAAVDGTLVANHTTLLSPFDPLVWDRERTRQIFNFNFSIECYLPKEKRKYGYFLLPILHNGELVGRLDAKAHRKDKVFEVISLYLENSVIPTRELAVSVAGAIQNCAAWHQTPQVVLTRCASPAFEPHLRAAIDSL